MSGTDYACDYKTSASVSGSLRDRSVGGSVSWEKKDCGKSDCKNSGRYNGGADGNGHKGNDKDKGNDKEKGNGKADGREVRGGVVC